MLKQRNRPTTPSKYSENNNSIASPPSSMVSSVGGGGGLPTANKRSPADRKSSSTSLQGRGPLGPKPPSHWSRDIKEVTVVTSHDGIFNFRIVGGSDNGEFPVIAEVLPPDTRGVEYRGGGMELTTQVLYKKIIL
jgi:hypothetical protein